MGVNKKILSSMVCINMLLMTMVSYADPLECRDISYDIGPDSTGIGFVCGPNASRYNPDDAGRGLNFDDPTNAIGYGTGGGELVFSYPVHINSGEEVAEDILNARDGDVVVPESVSVSSDGSTSVNEDQARTDGTDAGIELASRTRRDGPEDPTARDDATQQAQDQGRTSAPDEPPNSPRFLEPSQVPQPTQPNSPPPTELTHNNDAQESADQSGHDPVHPATGEFIHKEVDMLVPGVGMDFVFKRTYRSHASYHGTLGHGWDHNYNQRLIQSQEGGAEPTLYWSTGSGYAIKFESCTGGYTPVPYVDYKLERISKEWQITSPEGIAYVFDEDGLLFNIVDLNGNSIELQWEPSSRANEGWRLTEVQDTLGRTFTLSYGQNGYLSRVALSGGSQALEASFVVDANGHLVETTDYQNVNKFYAYDVGHPSQSGISVHLLKPWCQAQCGVTEGGASCNGNADVCSTVALESYNSCMGACRNPEPCLDECPSLCDSACALDDGSTCSEACDSECDELCEGAARSISDNVESSCGETCDDYCNGLCGAGCDYYIDHLDDNFFQQVWESFRRELADLGMCFGEVVWGCAASLFRWRGGGCNFDCPDTAERADIRDICNQDCAECCFNGDGCGAGTSQAGSSCTGRCGSAVEQEVENLVFGDCSRACDRDTCESSCRGTCGPSCLGSCESSCINAPDNCADWCGSPDEYHATCEQSCVSTCLDEHALQVGGQPVLSGTYGKMSDLNHNLVELRIGSPSSTPYLINTYGDSNTDYSFDKVVHQVFGDQTITFDYEQVYVPEAGEYDIKQYDEEEYAVDVCPHHSALDCINDEALNDYDRPVETEIWSRLREGFYASFTRREDTLSIYTRIAEGLIPDGPIWVTVRQEGQGYVFDPPIVLPSGHFKTDGGDFGTYDIKQNLDGSVAIDVIKAGDDTQLPTGEQVWTFVHTSTGWLGFDQTLKGFVQLSGDGYCTAEVFTTTFDLQTKQLQTSGDCKGSVYAYHIAQNIDAFGQGATVIGESNDLTMDFDKKTFSVKPTHDGVANGTPNFIECTLVMGSADHKDDKGQFLPVGAQGCTKLSDEQWEDMSLVSMSAIQELADGKAIHVTEPGCLIGPDKYGPVVPSAGDAPMFYCRPTSEQDVVVMNDTLSECIEGYDHATRELLGHASQPITSATYITDPDGIVWAYFSDDSGRVLRSVNTSNGAKTQRNYDGLGRLVGEMSPYGDRLCYAYDDDSQNIARATHLPLSRVVTSGLVFDTDHLYQGTEEPIEVRFEWGEHSRLKSITNRAIQQEPLAQMSWSAQGNLEQATDGEGNVSTFAYDAKGRLLERTSPAGHVTAMTYGDPSHGLATQTSVHLGPGDSFTTTLQHDSLGRPLKVIKPDGVVQEFTWSSNNLVDQVKEYVGSGFSPISYSYQYDSEGQPSQITSPLTTTTLHRNPSGSLEASTTTPLSGSGESRSRCLKYNGIGLVIEQVEATGRRTRTIRDAGGHVVRVEQGFWAESSEPWDDRCPSVSSTLYHSEVVAEYDRLPSGHAFEARQGVDPQSGLVFSSVRHGFDGFGRPVASRQADGRHVRVDLDSRGLVTMSATFKPGSQRYDRRTLSSLDRSNSDIASMQRYSYDANGRPLLAEGLLFVDEDTGRRWPYGEPWLMLSQTQYLDAQATIIQTNGENESLQTRFDPLGRALEKTLANGQQVLYAYNNTTHDGYTVKYPSSGPEGEHAKAYTFGPFGLERVVSEGSGTDTFTWLENNYDGLGRLVRRSEPEMTQVFDYNDFEELITIGRSKHRDWTGVVDDQVSERIIIDVVGRTVTLEDGLGRPTMMAQDALGRQSEVTFPDSTKVTYNYIPGTGALDWVKSRDKVVHQYSYDATGRPVRVVSQAPGSSSRPAVHLDYSYDVYGLQRATSTVGDLGQPDDQVSTDVVRDSLGRAISIGSSLWDSDPIAVTHDRVGRPLSYTMAGRDLQYSYDNLGRLHTLGSAGTTHAQYIYDGLGPAISKVLGNGLTERWDFDAFERPIGSNIRRDAGGEVLEHLDVYWTRAGQVGRIDRTILQQSPSASLFYTDPYGRLQAEEHGLTLGEAGHDMVSGKFSLAGGNPSDAHTTRGIKWSEYEFDSANNWSRVTRGDGIAIESDVMPIADTDNRYTDFDGELFTDSDGRLLDDGSAQYSYDALGRLMSVYVPGPEEQTWSFSYDAFGRLVAWTMDALSEQKTVKFQYAAGQIIRQSSDGQESHFLGMGSPSVMLTGSDAFYIHGGWAHRARAITSSAGNLVETYAHDGFGRATIRDANGTALEQSSVGFDLLQSGQPYLPELKLQRMGARWYKPSWGRFITPDPALFADGANYHAFVGNRPMSFYDPSGLWRRKVLEVGDNSYDYVVGMIAGANPLEDVKPYSINYNSSKHLSSTNKHFLKGKMDMSSFMLVADAYGLYVGLKAASFGGWTFALSGGTAAPASATVAVGGALVAVGSGAMAAGHANNFAKAREQYLSSTSKSTNSSQTNNQYIKNSEGNYLPSPEPDPWVHRDVSYKTYELFYDSKSGKWKGKGIKSGKIITPKGKQLFVVTENGKTIITRPATRMAESLETGRKIDGGVPVVHEELAGGKPVQFAGEIDFTAHSGKIKTWNNASGHYRPNASDSSRAVILPQGKFNPHLFD